MTKEIEQIEWIERCPYCVSSDEFRPMIDDEERGFHCERCGHVSMPNNRAFRCTCLKCLTLRVYNRSDL